MQDERQSSITLEPNGSEAPLFPEASVRLSSQGAGWRNLSVERLHLDIETPPHYHGDHFLTLHLGAPAQIEMHQAGRHLRLKALPGEFALIGSGEEHQVRYENADVLAVSLAPALVRSVAEEVGRGAAVDRLELIPQHASRDPQVERLGHLLKAELEVGAPTGPLFADAIGQALAAHLLRSYSTLAQHPVSEPGGLSPSQLRRALDFLEAHLDCDVSLKDMADAAGLSSYHFARQFKAATGLAPHAYLVRRRIEQAKALLTQTRLPIAAIAAQVGFAHQSHLTRHFKRLVGTTPARFR